MGLRSTYMGLRVGEARALEGSAYRDGYLTISQAPVDNRTEAPMKGTKTRKIRRLPVPPQVAEWIERHIPVRDRMEETPLFRNPRGHTESKRWSPSALDRAWNSAREAAVGYRIAPLYEATRHSFATLALNDGAELHSVQKFLGHTDSKTTERYAKLADHALVSVLRTKTVSG